MRQNRSLAVLGLRLSRQALRVLKERGIYAHAPVSLEHQHLAKRYVVRGLESGGAAGDVGRYVTFPKQTDSRSSISTRLRPSESMDCMQSWCRRCWCASKCSVRDIPMNSSDHAASSRHHQ